MENINGKTEYPCSGCGACAAVCPKSAICLEMDKAGLLTACVDESRCVGCGLCIQSCHRFSKEAEGVDLRDSTLYAVQSANADTVKRCSSGGLAHELAVEAILSGGGAVGAVYDTETNRVFHEIVNTESDIQKLDGSKYLQSNPQRAFTGIVKEARHNPETYFTVFGTPCQIAGLAKCCEALHIRGQFLLVEIFCHGVPPYQLWEYQAERMGKKLGVEHFDDIQFRFKKDDWHSYCLRASAEGRSFYGIRERDFFWHVYFENILLGDACMSCRLRKEKSLADLRIGDYWGKRYQGRSDGVSAAFACTERGKVAMERLISSGRLIVLEPGTPEEMLKAQNMEGYRAGKLHDEAMRMLRDGQTVGQVVHQYRVNQDVKSRVKRNVLRVSGLLPDDLRAKLRRVRSILLK